MSGKAKFVFEDLMIFLVISIVIFLSYFAYDKYSNENHIEKVLDNITLSTKTFYENIPSKINEFMKNVQLNVSTESLIDTTKEILPIPESNTTISKIDNNITLENILDINSTKEFTNIQLNENEIKTPISTDMNTSVIKDIKVDKARLKLFIHDVKSNLTNSIIQSKDLNSTKSLRFRITILPSGNYEQLTFVDGNKELFKNNKDNILKIFPLNIDDTIQGGFPRYLRLNIK